MFRRRLSFILVLLFILSSTFTLVAHAYWSAEQEEESLSDLIFIITDESTPENEFIGPEAPTGTLPDELIALNVNEDNSTFEIFQEDSYTISRETIPIGIQTYINEHGEQLYPWELPYGDFSSNERRELGQVVEIDFIIVRPNERFEVNEYEKTFVTDRQLLYVIFPSLGDEPESIYGDRSNEIGAMATAPWRWRQLAVLDSNSTPGATWYHGRIQLAAQVIANGSVAHLFNERQFTGAFPSTNSDLRLATWPTILRNNTNRANLETNFSVTRVNGVRTNIIFSLSFNGAGNITGHFVHGPWLTIQ